MSLLPRKFQTQEPLIALGARLTPPTPQPMAKSAVIPGDRDDWTKTAYSDLMHPRARAKQMENFDPYKLLELRGGCMCGNPNVRAPCGNCSTPPDEEELAALKEQEEPGRPFNYARSGQDVVFELAQVSSPNEDWVEVKSLRTRAVFRVTGLQWVKNGWEWCTKPEDLT